MTERARECAKARPCEFSYFILGFMAKESRENQDPHDYHEDCPDDTKTSTIEYSERWAEDLSLACRQISSVDEARYGIYVVARWLKISQDKPKQHCCKSWICRPDRSISASPEQWHHMSRWEFLTMCNCAMTIWLPGLHGTSTPRAEFARRNGEHARSERVSA